MLLFAGNGGGFSFLTFFFFLPEIARLQPDELLHNKLNYLECSMKYFQDRLQAFQCDSTFRQPRSLCRNWNQLALCGRMSISLCERTPPRHCTTISYQLCLTTTWNRYLQVYNNYNSDAFIHKNWCLPRSAKAICILLLSLARDSPQSKITTGIPVYFSDQSASVGTFVYKFASELLTNTWKL